MLTINTKNFTFYSIIDLFAFSLQILDFSIQENG